MDIYIKNDDGSDYEITTETFKGEVRDFPYGSLLGSFSFAVVDAAGGHVVASMAHAVTSALLTAARSVYDPVPRQFGIEMTTAVGTVLNLATGYAYVTAEVAQ